MADFTESLGLDISSALRDIDRLDAAVTSTAVRFKTQLAQSIDQLRDVTIDVTADTSTLTRSVRTALENADTSVTVTGDTGPLTRETTAAVDRADTEATVTADTSQARREVERLGTSAEGAVGGINLLRTALGFLSGAAILQAIRTVGDAASSVAEQVTGSEVVFGDAAITVQRFAESASQIGLAEDAALRSANAFGQLAISAGLADDEIADFATTIVARGSDIASLRDLDLGQTLEALRSGLVGETEPLRNLGIFLNEATVQAEAMRLGLADATGEVDDAGKIQARYSLILQQSEIAAGNFALTSDGLANSQRVLAAEFRNTIAEAGQKLTPALLDLMGVARDELLPAIGDLAGEALPALVDVLIALSPALGITLDIVGALAPAIQTMADVIDAIPGPLLAIGAGALLVDRLSLSFGRLQTKALASGTALSGVRVALSRLGSGLTGTPGLAATAGLTAVLVAAGAAAEAGINPLDDLAATVLRLGDSFTGFGSGRTDEVSGQIKDLIGSLDLNKLDEASLAIGTLREELDGLDDREGAGRIASFAGVNLFATGGDADRQEAIDQIRSQIDAIESNAEAELTAGVITGRFTQAQVAAAEATARREGSTSAVVTALANLRNAEQIEQAEAERTIARYGPLVDQFVNVAETLGRVQDVAPSVATAIRDIRVGSGDSESGFLNLATAIDQANLSQEQLGDVAATLGVDLDSLSGFVDRATGALDDFISTAVGQLPSVSSVFADTLAQAQADAERFASAIEDPEVAQRIRDDARVTAEALTTSLVQATVDLGDFRSDLATIAAAGFVDLAGLLAEQGPDVGGQLADELEQALADGNTEILDGLSAANTAFQTESNQTVDFIKNDLAPRLIIQSGLLGEALTDSFGEGLDFEERIRIAAAIAESGLDEAGQGIAAVAAVEGEGAARAYGDALDLDQATIDAGVAAGLAIQQAGLAEAGAGAADQLINGLLLGLSGGKFRAKQAAEDTAQAVIDGVNRRFGISSPSKVFMAIGGHLGEGLAIGLEAKVPRMLASTNALLALSAQANDGGHLALAGAAPATGTPAFDDSRIVGALGKLGDNGGIHIDSLMFVGGDPGTQMSELRRTLRARQFVGR